MELFFRDNFVNFLSYYRFAFCPTFFSLYLNVLKYQCLPHCCVLGVIDFITFKSWFFFLSSSISFFKLLTSNSTLLIFSAFSVCKMEFDCARSRSVLTLLSTSFSILRNSWWFSFNPSFAICISSSNSWNLHLKIWRNLLIQCLEMLHGRLWGSLV